MTNRYEGTCYVCGLPVPAGAGVIWRGDAASPWRVRHTVGQTRGAGECDNGRPARTKFRPVVYPWQQQ